MSECTSDLTIAAVFPSKFLVRVHAGLSVFLGGDAVAVAVSVGDGEGRLVFEWRAVGLADVHPVLLCLQVLVVALVFVVVLGLAVVGGGVARERRGWGDGGRPGVTEARGLRARKTVKLLGRASRRVQLVDALAHPTDPAVVSHSRTHRGRLDKVVLVGVRKRFSQGHVTRRYVILEEQKKTNVTMTSSEESERQPRGVLCQGIASPGDRSGARFGSSG